MANTTPIPMEGTTHRVRLGMLQSLISMPTNGMQVLGPSIQFSIGLLAQVHEQFDLQDHRSRAQHSFAWPPHLMHRPTVYPLTKV